MARNSREDNGIYLQQIGSGHKFCTKLCKVKGGVWRSKFEIYLVYQILEMEMR